MGPVWSSCVVAGGIIGIIAAEWSGASSLRADEKINLFRANSVWQGTMQQSEPKHSYPVILFVSQRKGDSFEGATWYPTLGNAVVQVTGRVDSTGSVTFTEDKIIQAGRYERDGRKMVVVAGIKYKAELKKSEINGTGEFVLSKTKEVATLKFSLKLAE